jgi:hypothetical protein
MKTHITGTRNGLRWPVAGEVKELPENEAVELITAGLAEPVADAKVERAVARKSESRKA